MTAAEEIVVLDDPKSSVVTWLSNAAGGLPRRLQTTEDWDAAREGAKAAFLGQPFLSVLTSRRQVRIYERAYQLVETALHLDDLTPVRFLLTDTMDT